MNGKRKLPILTDDDRGALVARWPDPVLDLEEAERLKAVRMSKTTLPDGYGGEVVLLDGPTGVQRRGFVRAILQVPLEHERGAVYGIYVEVDRVAYQALRAAAVGKKPVRVWGTLATRLPFLEDAYGTQVEIVEEGGERRPRVVDAKSDLLREGPQIGPRDP